MPNDDLTLAEKSILLILMAEVIELPNVVLTHKYHIKFEGKNREKVMRLGYVRTRTEKRRLFWELTDLGWKRGLEELGAEVPPGAGTPGAALYAMLGTIRHYLDHTGVPFQDFFQPETADEQSATPPPTAGPATPADVEAHIREAYGELAAKRGDPVTLTALRGKLGPLPRSFVDEVLVAMNRRRVAALLPESNQKSLTKQDHEAAVIIGDQPKHLITIGSR